MRSAPFDLIPSPLLFSTANSRKTTSSDVTSNPSPAPAWLVKSRMVSFAPCPLITTLLTSRDNPSVRLNLPLPNCTMSPDSAAISASCNRSCAFSPALTSIVFAHRVAGDIAIKNAAMSVVNFLSMFMMMQHAG